MKNLILALIGVFTVALWVADPAKAQEARHPDIALRSYILNVLSDHPALRQAEAELKAVEAHARAQGQPLYNPELELEYDDSFDRSKSVGVSQTLSLSGKRGARASVAAAGVAAAEARLAIARKALLANILSALADYQAAKETLDISETRVALDEEFMALAERRNRAGDLPQSEFLTARLTLAEARAAESEARIALSQTEQNLSSLTGGLSTPPPPLMGLPSKGPASIDQVTLEALPELRLSGADAEAARQSIRVAKKNRIPDPTFGVRVGEEEASPDPFGRRDSTTLFGVRLSVPIPVRNSYSAEVDVAQSDLIAAEQSYNDLHRRVEARLRTSFQRHQTALLAWQSWTAQGAAPLEEQRALLQRLWEAGEIGAVDYIIQLNQTFATESAGIELKGRLWTTWFDWLEASASISEWVENSQ